MANRSLCSHRACLCSWVELYAYQEWVVCSQTCLCQLSLLLELYDLTKYEVNQWHFSAKWKRAVVSPKTKFDVLGLSSKMITKTNCYPSKENWGYWGKNSKNERFYTCFSSVFKFSVHLNKNEAGNDMWCITGVVSVRKMTQSTDYKTCPQRKA